MMSRVLFLSVLLVASGIDGAEIKLGVAESDITPPLGIPMAGYYHERGADGLLDPLRCKAMVIECGGERAAFVVLDLIGITREVTDAARQGVTDATGIRGDYVMVSATHAHTGPELSSRHGTPTGANNRKQMTADYTEGLPGKIVEAVQLAQARLKPVRLSLAVTRCDDLTFNRRFFMSDGSVGWNPGKLNPRIVLPAGTTDPHVSILHAEKMGAAGPLDTVATYVHFAMHPDTTGGSKISADWPGALSRVLAGYHGTNHQTVVANGTCGNLNHIDVTWPAPQTSPSEANRIGTILGAAVFRAYKRLKPVTGGSLRARSDRVELDLPEFTPQQLDEAKAILETTRTDAGTNFMRLVRAHRIASVVARGGEKHRAEVQVLALGHEVAWVGLPGEIFVELGLAIKKRSPFPQTFVVELANENLGYIPDRRSYAEGNYEPESARCAAGSGERLVDSAVRLLNELNSSAER